MTHRYKMRMIVHPHDAPSHPGPDVIATDYCPPGKAYFLNPTAIYWDGIVLDGDSLSRALGYEMESQPGQSPTDQPPAQPEGDTVT